MKTSQLWEIAGAATDRARDGRTGGTDVDGQRVTIEGRPYVLVTEQRYESLLQRLAAPHRESGRDEPAGGLEWMLARAGFDGEQVRGVLQAPTFGARLQRLRLGRKLDQIALARLAGVSQTMVSNLENDKVERPSARALHRLLESLGMPGAAAYFLMAAPCGTPVFLPPAAARPVPPRKLD